MVAIHLSVIRCFLNLSSVFSSWSVCIGTSPSFDRAVSWLVRVDVLTSTPGCSVCWFTDFFSWRHVFCSAMLHCSAYKGRHFHWKSKLISIVEKMQVLQGAVLDLHATLRNLNFICIRVSPDGKKLVIQKLIFTKWEINKFDFFFTL